VSRAKLRPHTPSVQLTSTTTEQQRQHKEQAGREASWLKEVRKVERVGKNEKWVTRPRGGEGVKTNLLKKQNENDWWEGKKSEKRFKKRLNHVC
jgi:hypothetical protein